MATKRQINTAKAALVSAGITKKRLAKTTGTTKAEMTTLFRKTATRMATGKTTKADTARIRKALVGGPTAGIARTPASRAKAKAQTRTARKTYRATTTRKMPRRPII